MEIVPDEELRARLAEAADNADNPEIAHQALRLLRSSIALARADAQGCDRTRIGGLPPLPAEIEWPTFDGRPLTLLVQLDCAALRPLLGDDWPLPHDGLLLFFFDDTFADLKGADGRVLHVPGDAPERSAPPGTVVLSALPLAAVRTPSLPEPTSRAIDDYLGAYDLVDAMDAVQALHEVLPQVDYRLLGWHQMGGDGEGGARPLLQMETVEGADWGEVVNVSFWVDGDDLSAGGLDRVFRVVEVA
ncbi:DUF1963 domain-containing protein [Spirillospora sp. CA-255316]